MVLRQQRVRPFRACVIMKVRSDKQRITDILDYPRFYE